MFVDGVVVKEGGKLVDVDLKKLREELKASTEGILERAKTIS